MTIPYQHPLSNKISRLLAKYTIKTIPFPVRKNVRMLRQVKDKLGLKVTGI
jgi:hypothetical protein